MTTFVKQVARLEQDALVGAIEAKSNLVEQMFQALDHAQVDAEKAGRADRVADVEAARTVLLGRFNEAAEAAVARREARQAAETIIRVSCDMHASCEATVTMVDDNGYIYCTQHGLDRRGSGTYRRNVRKLRPHETNRLNRGEQIKSY